jgi:hypothetical protein
VRRGSVPRTAPAWIRALTKRPPGPRRGAGWPPEPPYLPDQQAAVLSASAREDA